MIDAHMSETESYKQKGSKTENTVKVHKLIKKFEQNFEFIHRVRYMNFQGETITWGGGGYILIAYIIWSIFQKSLMSFSQFVPITSPYEHILSINV